MEDAYFDIAFHGTLVDDCIEIKNFDQDKTVVFDNTELYGSTFDDIESLRNSRFVSEVEIFKYNKECLIEAYPMFLRPKGNFINKISDTNISNFCEFITIDHHFLILEDSKYYKIPYNKTQLVDTTYFNFTERHLVNKLIKGEIDCNTLKDKMSDKTKRILFNGIVGDRTDYEECMREYFQNFGYKPFLYPKHGFRDLSEIISRSNAMCGTAYVLDKNIKIYQITSEIDTIMPSPLSDNYEKGNCDNYEKEGNNYEKENDNKDNNSEDEDNIELIERFDNLRFSTEEEDNIESDEHSEENHHTGEISSIINNECCENRRFRNNGGCFDPLGCDTETREYLSKDNIYKVGEGSGSYKHVMKNELSIFTISEIMTSNKNGQEKDVNLNQFKQNQFENIISKTKEGYKFLIESSFGNIFAKSLIMEKLSPSNIYVRVLNIKEKLIKEKFFAYLYNGKSFIQVLSIDSSSMCCTKGTFLIYLIKKYSKITDDDLKILKIHSCHVITDVSFRINGSL